MSVLCTAVHVLSTSAISSTSPPLSLPPSLSPLPPSLSPSLPLSPPSLPPSFPSLPSPPLPPSPSLPPSLPFPPSPSLPPSLPPSLSSLLPLPPSPSSRLGSRRSCYTDAVQCWPTRLTPSTSAWRGPLRGCPIRHSSLLTSGLWVCGVNTFTRKGGVYM